MQFAIDLLDNDQDKRGVAAEMLAMRRRARSG